MKLNKQQRDLKDLLELDDRESYNDNGVLVIDSDITLLEWVNMVSIIGLDKFKVLGRIIYNPPPTVIADIWYLYDKYKQE